MRTVQSDLRATGFTLIEQLVAAAILTVAAVGAFQYQYYTAAMGRIASGQTAAARAAHLLLEDWKSTGGSTAYDPSSLGLGFSSGLSVPGGFYDARRARHHAEQCRVWLLLGQSPDAGHAEVSGRRPGHPGQDDLAAACRGHSICPSRFRRQHVHAREPLRRPAANHPGDIHAARCLEWLSGTFHDQRQTTQRPQGAARDRPATGRRPRLDVAPSAPGSPWWSWP